MKPKFRLTIAARIVLALSAIVLLLIAGGAIRMVVTSNDLRESNQTIANSYAEVVALNTLALMREQEMGEVEKAKASAAETARRGLLFIGLTTAATIALTVVCQAQRGLAQQPREDLPGGVGRGRGAGDDVAVTARPGE